MVPIVKSVVDANMIRDGGSLTATFHDPDGSEWILLLQIKQVSHPDRVERLGFTAPVLIDADPAKRPMHAENHIVSERRGPSCQLSWEEAEALVGQMTALATTLNTWAASSLRQLRTAVESRGAPPPIVTRVLPRD
jgi:hypothetical protein